MDAVALLANGVALDPLQPDPALGERVLRVVRSDDVAAARRIVGGVHQFAAHFPLAAGGAAVRPEADFEVLDERLLQMAKK